MKTILLQKGSLQAEILPEKGGTLVQLRLDGVDFLYRDEDNLRSPERPRCGVPFLFPIFGRLKDGTYTWEDRAYRLGIHGFGHTSAWAAEDAADDHLRLVLASSPETKAVYPFDFRVEMDFRLEEDAIRICLKFENTGKTPLPYNYGFHPYFLAERPENIRVAANAAARIDFATGQALPFGHGHVTISIPEGAPEAGAALAGIQSPAVIHIPEEGRRLTMEFDNCFSQMVFWTQAGKKFLCVEPINGKPNGLNTGNYLTLAPGETREAFLRFRPERL